jgi:MYXO-CTERM domain-containing protein
MAQKRSSQRGVIRVASSVMLVLFGLLLSLTGCSAGDQDESLGEVSQALCTLGAFCCGSTTCQDLGPCVTVSCDQNIKNTCVYTNLQDGDGCKNASGQGICTTPALGAHAACCTGCVTKGRDGLVCQKGTQIAACGSEGAECLNCDTGNACVDSCQQGKCVDDPVADGAPCRESPGFCNSKACCTGCVDGNGVCQLGDTVSACGISISNAAVKCATCKDGNPCTADACNAVGKCVAPAEPDGRACPNATKCDGDETCKGGNCQAVANFMCPTDNNACHAPSCDPVTGCAQQNLTGTTCPDANLCNGTEKCNNGVCNVPGTPKNCNDNNPCTFDDCDPKTGGCIHTPLAAGELCENGDVCDGIGVCDDNAKCVVQPAQPCDNSDPCKVVGCDKVKGCVVTSFTAAACNDGDPCTTVDKCNGAGTCVGSVPQKCDDGNECTTDSCVKGQGCKAVAVTDGGTCDDGNDCSTGDTCMAGKCKSSGGKTCPDDTNPCTTASCDPANQVCGQSNDNTQKCQTDKCHQFTQCANGNCPVGAAIDCADANPCTKDACDPAKGCTHDPDDTATCTDNDLCTENDSCQNGKCVAKPVVCEAVDDCHKVGTCNDKSGFCDAPRADVGTPCENDTGKCDDKAKCIPNPTGGGGAGGETNGGAGPGAGGEPLVQGGEPTTPSTAGEGNEPTMGGEPGAVATGGKAGKSSGGSASNEGGAPEVPDHVFVRDPGGCSCTVPSSQPSNNLAWLGALALAGVLARRRRVRRAVLSNVRGF